MVHPIDLECDGHLPRSISLPARPPPDSALRLPWLSFSLQGIGDLHPVAERLDAELLQRLIECGPPLLLQHHDERIRVHLLLVEGRNVAASA